MWTLFDERKKLKMSFITLSYSVKLFLKLARFLLIGPAENCPKYSDLFFSSATFNSDILGFGGFRIASCDAPQTYFHDVQIWRTLRWPLLLFNHLRTMALLSEKYSARIRATCILLYLPLRLAAVGCTLQWSSKAEINKQFKFTSQCCHCRVKLALCFV